MSYSVVLCRREVAGAPGDLFEQPERIPAFSAAEREMLATFLEKRSYELAGRDGATVRFRHFAIPDITATLTERSLSLSSSVDQESVLTILELGAELAMLDEFALYNPQEGRWNPVGGEPRASAQRSEDVIRRAEATLERHAAWQKSRQIEDRSTLVATLSWIVAGAVLGYLVFGRWGILMGVVVGFVARVVQVKLGRMRRR